MIQPVVDLACNCVDAGNMAKVVDAHPIARRIHVSPVRSPPPSKSISKPSLPNVS